MKVIANHNLRAITGGIANLGNDVILRPRHPFPPSPQAPATIIPNPPVPKALY